MTPKEAFKIGFLEKCAEDRCTNEEIMQRIQHAKFMIKSSTMGGAAIDSSSRILRGFLPWALLAPPVAGLAGGAMLAGAQDDTYDKDEARKREELAEYHRAIERLQKLQSRQHPAGMM